MTAVARLTAAVDTLVADAEALAATPDAPGRHAGYARDILAAARHLAAVLAAAPTPPVMLDLAALAEEAVTMAAMSAEEKGIALTASGHAAPAHGDERSARQILANLVANAVKFTPDGGAVTVTAGPGATIEVRDTGPGVPPADAQRIFESFQQGGGAAGVGLGLSISRRLARDMGGDLVLVPADAGACFRLTLPPA